MTVWQYGVSWSKLKLALECPQQLIYTIDKVPYGEAKPNYYMSLGIVVQKVFELYFNQGINLKVGGISQEVIFKCAMRVLDSKWMKDLGVTYVPGKDEEALRAEVVAHVMGGYLQFEKIKLLNKKVRSEVDWGATFRNLRLFGKMDFVYDSNPTSVYIFDGKGHKEKNADPRQLLFYALVAHASGKEVRGGGFLYWQHDFEKVDLSFPRIQEFIEGDFSKGSQYFHLLKTGVEVLPAQPESSKCWMCNWNRVCKSSAKLAKEVVVGAPELLGLEGL